MSHNPTFGPTPDDQGAWDNEGGHLPPSTQLEELGITKTLLESFSVGDYRYTNLSDAIVQARREQTQRETADASP